MSEENVTRGEFTMLAQRVEENGRRLEQLDMAGPRGNAALQLQVTEVMKDVTELKGDMNARFAEHALEHKQANKDRVISRRWMIGMAVAGLAAVASILGLLVEIMSRVH